MALLAFFTVFILHTRLVYCRQLHLLYIVVPQITINRSLYPDGRCTLGL